MGEKTATFSIAGLTFDWSIIISTTVTFAIVFFLAFWMSRKLVMKPAGASSKTSLNGLSTLPTVSLMDRFQIELELI